MLLRIAVAPSITIAQLVRPLFYTFSNFCRWVHAATARRGFLKI